MSDTPKLTSSLKRRCALYTAAAAVLVSACATPSTIASVAGPDSIRLSPPEPTGPHAVGRFTMHLADKDRSDPWVDQQKREIMTSVWYPADADSAKSAPYASDAMAQQFSLQLEQAGASRDAVDIADSDTNATVAADVADTGENLPVVLYSPGFEMSRHHATAQAEELASRGYVVVTMDHTYEGKAVEFPDGRVKRQHLPEEKNSTNTFKTAMSTRVSDVELTLDSLTHLANGGNPDVNNRKPPTGLGAALDLSHVGMFGHSAGGFTAAEAMLEDDRIDAGINLDGTIAYHVGDKEWGTVTKHGLDRPFMIMGGGVTGSDEVPHTSERSPDWKMFRKASSGDTLELYMAEAEHMSFLDSQWIFPLIDRKIQPTASSWEEDMQGSIGTIGPQASLTAQRAYITAYFDEKLRGKEQPLLDGPSNDHPDVEFIG